MLEKNPTKILRKAVLGMMKRSNLRHQAMEPRLKIYVGPTHPHTGQLPAAVEPLPRHPRKRRGMMGFQLHSAYATEHSYQETAPSRIKDDDTDAMELE
jgi:hypothetical protein